MVRNALFIVGAAGLGLAPGVAMAGSVTLVATLDGASETGGGDPDGTGRFSAEFDPDTGDVCYVLVADKISKPTAAHIHSGAAGTDGGPVLTIEVTGPDGDMCMAAEPDVLKPIVATPSAYYVNVHTADFPKGAVRGQLANKK